MKIIRAKLIVIGPHSVGKTSVVTRYESKIFYPQMSCTVGASFSNIEVKGDGYKVKLQVWDTAGQERFRAMAPMYYRGATGAVLVFDLTKPESLSDLKEWTKDLLSLMDPNSLVLAVAGNKCDAIDDRRVREKDGRDFAKSIDAKYFETSAKENTGINELFEYVGKKIGRNSLEEQANEKANQRKGSEVRLESPPKPDLSDNSQCCR